MKIGSYYFVGENVSHSTLLWKRKKAQVYVNLCCSVTLMLPLLTVQFYVCCCLQMQLVIVCPQQWHYEHMECRRTRFGCILPFSLVVCRLLDILCDSVQTYRFSQVHGCWNFAKEHLAESVSLHGTAVRMVTLSG